MAKIKAGRVHKFIKPYVVESGKHFRLKDHDLPIPITSTPKTSPKPKN